MDEVRKDVMVSKILKEPDDYTVCMRCGVINLADDESECWRCGYEDFNSDVEEGIRKLKDDEWDYDFEDDDWKYRYVDVGLVEED